MPKGESPKACAVRLLARREHARLELFEKLKTRGHALSDIEKALDALTAQGLLSDARFAEAYTRARMQAGFGPRHIRLSLQQKGVSASDTDGAFAVLTPDWDAMAKAACLKKFKILHPKDAALQMKMHRFLTYRGFLPPFAFLKG